MSKFFEKACQQWIDYIEKNVKKEIYGDIKFFPYNEDYCVQYKHENIDSADFISFTLLGSAYKMVVRDTGEMWSISFKSKNAYKGGRYFNFHKDGIIDFNFATNLLCAYSDRYNCDIPKNEFGIEINAGEKPFIRRTMLQYHLLKCTAFNTNILESGDISVGVKNTDRVFVFKPNQPLDEVIDIIWAEGVERGKKEKRDSVKMMMGTESM